MTVLKQGFSKICYASDVGFRRRPLDRIQQNEKINIAIFVLDVTGLVDSCREEKEERKKNMIIDTKLGIMFTNIKVTI